MATAFERPHDFSFAGPDLRVALERNGQFDWGWEDPATGHLGRRLRVERVHSAVNEGGASATLVLNPAGEYDSDGSAIMPPLKTGELTSLLHPDTRLVVYAQIPEELSGGGSDTRRFLFDGYPSMQRLRLAGGPRNAHQDYVIACTSVFGRLARERKAWISGRRMLDADGKIQVVEALPTIFNFDSRTDAQGTGGNRHPELQTIDGVDVPVFTYDGDPRGKWWTYADVLTYLLHFHLVALGPAYPLRDGNGIDMCADAVGDEAITDLGSSVNVGFGDVIKLKADELNCQGVTLVEALLLWCRASGCLVQQWTDIDAGEPDTQLLFSYSGEGGPWRGVDRAVRSGAGMFPTPARAMRLEKQGFVPADGRCTNDVHQADIAWDSNAVINSCRVLGAVQKHEITAGKGPYSGATLWDSFVPGWKPDTTFGDNLSGSDLTSKIFQLDQVGPDATGTPLEMWQRYVASEEGKIGYPNVGRLWILDEAGELIEDAADYAHTNGGSAIWNQARYQSAYNFHVNAGVPRVVDPATGQQTIDWVRRRRRMLRPLSHGPGGEFIGALILCSWDSGTNWYKYPGNYIILDDRIGIRLTDQNLHGEALRSPVSPFYSVWEAIVRGTFRIAATFTVESDARVEAESHDQQVAFANFDAHQLSVVRGGPRFEQRESSSILKADEAYSFTDLDETTRAKSLADRMVSIAHARQVSGEVIIPWLTLDWLPGDRVTGFQPRGVAFNASKGARYPQVVMTRWNNTEGGQSTEVVLDDLRRAIRKAEAWEA